MRFDFVAVGTVLIGVSIYLFVRRMVALLFGKSTMGRVEGHVVNSSDDSIAYQPIVTFVDSNGNTHRFTSPAGGSSRYPAVGTEVRVHYLPSNPEIAYVHSFLHMWAAPLGCAILRLAALAVLWVH